MKPPNYRPAPNPVESCKTCAYFKNPAAVKALCEMYGVNVDATATCDSWTATRSEVPMTQLSMIGEQRRDFSDAERKKLAGEGKAMADGSFPIVTVGDLKNAIQAIGRAKDEGAAKAHIKKRAKALGATELLPDSWRTYVELHGTKIDITLLEPEDGWLAVEDRDMVEPGNEPDADDLGPMGEVDDTLTNECPTCEGVGTLGGVPCPNVEAHLEATESVGGQQGAYQTSASQELELRRQRIAMLEGAPEKRDSTGRFSADVEIRTASDGKLNLTGYASATETPYEVLDFTETIARGAFKRTLADDPDVVLLINHEGLPLARTKSGTLTLSEDVRGLRVDAVLHPDDPDVKSLVPKMERGDLTEMSFAFRATQQEWDDDRTKRLIREVTIHRGDVSMVTHGANSATSAEISRRSADAPTEPTEVVSKPLHRSNVEWAKGRRAKLRRSR